MRYSEIKFEDTLTQETIKKKIYLSDLHFLYISFYQHECFVNYCYTELKLYTIIFFLC